MRTKAARVPNMTTATTRVTMFRVSEIFEADYIFIAQYLQQIYKNKRKS